MSMTPRKIGFYLHTSWEYAYPFAVRSWAREDFAHWWQLMRQLGVNLAMLWPLCEVMPAPLSSEDKAALNTWKQIVADARARGLECWITQTANCTTRPEIAAKPFKQRHFYPFLIDVRLDDPAAREAYFAHRAAMMAILDNADAYVTIDGDPGGYPNARPQQFLEVLQHDRQVLDELKRPDALLIPWLWSGWGADWKEHGAWQEAIEPLTAPVLERLKAEMPAPWLLLPGRSVREDWANGRDNFELAERAGLIEQSVLLTYEIIEYEPTPPAVVLQFDDIRRVLREEAPLIARSRGIMGNAQQPIMALPNLFFFARAAQDADYLQRSDVEVLHELAVFLGGDEAILAPAWQCLHLPLEALPADLPQRLRAATLKSEAARHLPGGPQNYLEILAAFVEVRRATLQAAALPRNEDAQEAGRRALETWWKVHRYVFSGEAGTEFRVEFSHPLLLAPLAARGLK